MPVPHISENFPFALDPDFQEVFVEEYAMTRDFIGDLYTMEPTAGQQQQHYGEIGTLPNLTEFDGNVNYSSQAEGYKTSVSFPEFTGGIQIRRKLWRDAQWGDMKQRPRALAAAAARTRQIHGARMLNNSFSVENFFYTRTDGLALCSNSHTTRSGASTSVGFDNLGTDTLSLVGVETSRRTMRKFRGDQAEIISVMGDELWVPIDLEEKSWEIINSSGKVETANNERNFHQGRYRLYVWEYLTSSTNWWLVDSTLKRQKVLWIDHDPTGPLPEFAMVEDFDTIVGKWRAYKRYSQAYLDWRWIFGNQVA